MTHPGTTTPSTPSDRRVPELDGIRGLAILLVLLYHFVAVAIPAEAPAGLLVLRQLLSNGWSGVDLFFVLSGFLITGILVDQRDTPNYFKVFYIRRITRIFPLYYLFLLLFLLMQRLAPRLGIFSPGLFDSSLPALPYFFYLQNFAMAFGGTFGSEFLAQTWSLAIEEQFYLFLPWFVRRSDPKRLPLNLFFFIALTLALRASVGGGSYLSFVLTPWRLDSLFLGSLLALLIRSPRALSLVKARLAWLRTGFLLLLLFWLYSTLTEELGSLDHLFVFALLYAALILLALLDPARLLGRLFRSTWLIRLGGISYGVYIYHQLVNGVLHDLFFRRPPAFHDLPTALVTLLALALTLLLAGLSYRLFEKRFIVWGHRYGYEDARVKSEIGVQVSSNWIK